MTVAGIPAADTTDMPAVHKVFRDSLAAAPRFVSSTAGDDGRREVIANYYANLIDFLRVHHEGEEEIVFPLLVERAPGQRALVDKAAGDHHQVVGLMAAVGEHLELWQAKGDDDDARGVLEALVALEAALVPHLDEEEADVLPLAAAHINAEEWGRLPGHAMSHFQGDKLWLILGLIRENFTQEQRDTMLAHMPPPAREMWETVGQRSFEELISQVRQG